MLLEVGRVCIKKNGRDAGSRAVVTKVIDSRFVNIVSSIRNKERKCNVSHLEFLNELIDPKDKALLNKTLGITEKQPRQATKAKS